jgi:sugar lactone lactonase YvrE
MPGHRSVRALLLVALAPVGSCSSGSTGPSASLGRLAVSITPTLIDASVTVTGPGGYTHHSTVSETLTDLPPGGYTATADPVTGPHPIVGTAHYDATVNGSPATVTAGATATLSVVYTPEPGSAGLLWVGMIGGPTLMSYAADRLGASTGAPPTSSVGTGNPQYGAAFDANGNLWVAQTTQNQVAEFTAAQLAAGGSPTPAVVLGSMVPLGGFASLSEPIGLAFDKAGNLWVANFTDNTISGYTPAQLASSGSPRPAVTLVPPGDSLDEPAGLAFDELGSLWVASANTNTVVAFTPTQLAQSGGPAPAVVFHAKGGSLSGPFSLAFDASGNLWVGNVNNTIVEFSRTQQGSGGSVAPAATITAVGVSLDMPAGLAFDASGDLWVANQPANEVDRFHAPTFRGGGPVIPDVIVSGFYMAGPAALAFYPPTGYLAKVRGP